jgi:ABC-type phosphate transport system auxiliary subunit
VSAADRDAAREVWDEIEDALKERVHALQVELTTSLADRMKRSGDAVRELEKKRFEQRKKELERAIGENQLARITKEAEKLRARARQLSLFAEVDQDIQKRLADLDAELALRRSHYEQVQQRLAIEAARTLEQVLPRRYALRGEARVYPIAVEIRLPGSGA